MAGMSDSLGTGMLGCEELHGYGSAGLGSLGMGVLLVGRRGYLFPADHQFQDFPLQVSDKIICLSKEIILRYSKSYHRGM